MKKIVIKDWFKNKITRADLRVDMDGFYSFQNMSIFEIEIEKETEKAILVKLFNCFDNILDGKKLWLPKSVVNFIEK